MLTIYRIVYGLVLGGFAGNLLTSTSLRTESTHIPALTVLGSVSLCCIFILLLGFSRIPTAAFWVLIAVWEAIFVWYAWFSPNSPFVLHETHNFDPAAAGRENMIHYIIAGAVFFVLFAWFLSLPIARSIYERRTVLHV